VNGSDRVLNAEVSRLIHKRKRTAHSDTLNRGSNPSARSAAAAPRPASNRSSSAPDRSRCARRIRRRENGRSWRCPRYHAAVRMPVQITGDASAAPRSTAAQGCAHHTSRGPPEAAFRATCAGPRRLLAHDRQQRKIERDRSERGGCDSAQHGIRAAEQRQRRNRLSALTRRGSRCTRGPAAAATRAECPTARPRHRPAAPARYDARSRAKSSREGAPRKGSAEAPSRIRRGYDCADVGARCDGSVPDGVRFSSKSSAVCTYAPDQRLQRGPGLREALRAPSAGNITTAFIARENSGGPSTPST